MRRRTFVALGAVTLAAAVPAVSGGQTPAGYSVTADADASSYATGPITDKTWIAFLANGDLKRITFSQPIAPQIDVLSAGALVTPGAITDGTSLGEITVWLQQTSSVVPFTLNLEAGSATSCMGTANVPAPASDGSPLTNEIRIATGNLAGLIGGAHCIGVRIDASPPSASPPSAGVVSLTVDITAIANVAIGTAATGRSLGPIIEADLKLKSAVTLANAMVVYLFKDNPAVDGMHPAWDIPSTITAVPCVAVAMAGGCDDAGTPVSSTVHETVGGSTGLTLHASSTKIVYGGHITLTGVATRGIAPSVGEAVTIASSATGPLSSPATTVALGAYSVTVSPTQSGDIYGWSELAGANTLYSDATTVTVVAPKPVVTKKTLKLTGGGKYTVTITVRRVAGITYTVKFGGKALTAKKGAKTVVFTGKKLKLKKGSVAVVTASAAGITKATLNVKLK